MPKESRRTAAHGGYYAFYYFIHSWYSAHSNNNIDVDVTAINQQSIVGICRYAAQVGSKYHDFIEVRRCHWNARSGFHGVKVYVGSSYLATMFFKRRGTISRTEARQRQQTVMVLMLLRRQKNIKVS
jgi:hypothetical protein